MIGYGIPLVGDIAIDMKESEAEAKAAGAFIAGQFDSLESAMMYILLIAVSIFFNMIQQIMKNLHYIYNLEERQQV